MAGRSGVHWVGLAAQIGFRVAQAGGTVIMLLLGRFTGFDLRQTHSVC